MTNAWPTVTDLAVGAEQLDGVGAPFDARERELAGLIGDGAGVDLAAHEIPELDLARLESACCPIFHAAPITDVMPPEPAAAPTRAGVRAGGSPSARGGAAMAQTSTIATAPRRVTRCAFEDGALHCVTTFIGACIPRAQAPLSDCKNQKF